MTGFNILGALHYVNLHADALKTTQLDNISHRI